MTVFAFPSGRKHQQQQQVPGEALGEKENASLQTNGARFITSNSNKDVAEAIPWKRSPMATPGSGRPPLESILPDEDSASATPVVASSVHLDLAASPTHGSEGCFPTESDTSEHHLRSPFRGSGEVGGSAVPLTPAMATAKDQSAQGKESSTGKKKARWSFRMARAVFSPGAALTTKSKDVDYKKPSDASIEFKQMAAQPTKQLKPSTVTGNQPHAATEIVIECHGDNLLSENDAAICEQTIDSSSSKDDSEMQPSVATVAETMTSCEPSVLAGGDGEGIIATDELVTVISVGDSGGEASSRSSKDIYFECRSQVGHTEALSESGSEKGQHRDATQEGSLSTPCEYSPPDQSPVSEEMSDSTPADVALPPATSEEVDTDLKPSQAPSESRSLNESPVTEHETSISDPAGDAESPSSSEECDINLDSAQAPQVQSVGLTNPDPVAEDVVEAVETASDMSDADAAPSASAAPSAAATNAIEPSSMSEVPGEGAAEPGAVEAVEEETAADEFSTVVDASENKPQGENCSQEPEKGMTGLGRRRNRRQAAKRELGLAYGLEDDQAKFSQAEVNAKIRERVAEEHAMFEKTIKSLKAAHEEQLKTAAEKMKQSCSEHAKLSTKGLESEIAMLSERFGEAAGEAKANGKALMEKEALLGAVTAQLMGLKAELEAERESRAEEKQALQKEADNERRMRAAAEGSLAQLEEEYNRLEDTERQKRAAGILKMKKDMQALAQQQFSAANQHFKAMKNKLEAVEAEAKQLREAAKEHAEKLEATGGETESLRDQVESLKKELLESSEEARRRERVYQDEIDAISDEADARRMEVETMAYERDAAKKDREVSQDALARMAIRNSQLKENITDLEGKVNELEDFCTQALDELDQEKAYSRSIAAKLPMEGDK